MGYGQKIRRIKNSKGRLKTRNPIFRRPLFRERIKSAAVKKEMAYSHSIAGAAQEEAGLLAAARAVAKNRVVVKRPHLGEFLNGENPPTNTRAKAPASMCTCPTIL